MDELPHQLTRANDWKGIEHILCDLRFVEAKVEAGMVFDLIGDYSPTEFFISAGYLYSDKMIDWRNFVVNSSHKLLYHNVPFLQVAYNYAKSGPVATSAEKQAAQFKHIWLRLLNRSAYIKHPDCLRILKGHKFTVKAIAITPDGRLIISGGGDFDTSKGELKVWNLHSGECLHTLEGHTDIVNSVAVTPDSYYALSGSDYKTMMLWDLRNGMCLRTFAGHTRPVCSIAITSDGQKANLSNICSFLAMILTCGKRL